MCLASVPPLGVSHPPASLPAGPVDHGGTLGCLGSVQATVQSVHSPSEHPNVLGLRVWLLGLWGCGQSPPALVLPSLVWMWAGGGCKAKKTHVEAPGGNQSSLGWGPFCDGAGAGPALPSRAPASWAGRCLLHAVAWCWRGRLSNPRLPPGSGFRCKHSCPQGDQLGPGEGVWEQGVSSGEGRGGRLLTALTFCLDPLFLLSQCLGQQCPSSGVGPAWAFPLMRFCREGSSAKLSASFNCGLLPLHPSLPTLLSRPPAPRPPPESALELLHVPLK